MRYVIPFRYEGNFEDAFRAVEEQTYPETKKNPESNVVYEGIICQ